MLPALAVLIVGRIVMWGVLGHGAGDENVTSVAGIAELVMWFAMVVAIFLGVLRFSKPAMFVFLIGAIAGIGLLVTVAIVKARNDNVFDVEDSRQLIQGLNVGALAAFGLAGLAMFFGTVRGVFTFFTTVPIGGVWIGTAALICVLSVMSGFESDLREKILGSNAHLQITKEEGDFVGWEAAKKKVDGIPGVVASTPYATSEVVIAANSNGASCIIKGIDPATVGKVTDLVNDIDEDTLGRARRGDAAARAADRRRAGSHRAANAGAAKPTGKVLDPAPDDLPQPGEPIDFSGGSDGSADPGSGSGSGSGSAGSGSGSAGSGRARARRSR